MKFLGIDYGLRKVGLALGDSEARLAVPLEVIESDRIVEMIQKTIAEEGIESVVVGLPTIDGGSVQLDKTKEFAEFLKTELKIPVYTIDESFTSVESQRIRSEQGSNVPEDALAAMLILQSYFDQSA